MIFSVHTTPTRRGDVLLLGGLAFLAVLFGLVAWAFRHRGPPPVKGRHYHPASGIGPHGEEPER